MEAIKDPSILKQSMAAVIAKTGKANLFLSLEIITSINVFIANYL